MAIQAQARARRQALVGLLLALSPWLAAAADRIVTVAPNLTELVCAVGACDKLVGVDKHSDYPQAAQKIPRIGDAFAINIEAVVALRPDLVLAWDSGTDPQRLRRLQQLGLKVAWIRARSLDQIGDALIQVGTLIGPQTQAVAQDAAQRYAERLRALRQRLHNSRRLSVLYQADANPLYTVNRESPISEAITLCGGVNAYADLPQLAGIVGIESVLARDPDVILFPSERQPEAVRREWRRWPMLKAVKHNALYAINDSLLARAAPRMLDGVEQLCAVLDRAGANTPP